MPEKNKGKRIRIGSLLVFLFLLLYIPSLFHWIYGDHVNSDILRIGLIEESTSTEGLLVRDELVLPPPSFDGKFIPEIPEGERTPAFYRVATVLNNSSMDLLKELDDIDSKIVQAQNEKAKKADFFSEDMVKIDKEIGQTVQNIILECNSNSLNSVSQLKGEIDKLIEKKAAVIGTDSNDSFIISLKQQKDALQNRIDSNTKQITSQFSGIISYVIDGCEQILTPKAIKDLTPKSVESIKTAIVNKNSSGNDAEAGKPFVKVIRGNETYIVTVFDTQTANLYKVGDVLEVRINDIGVEVNATVTGKSTETNGKVAVTVKIDRLSDRLTAMRKVSVDFIQNSEEGLKIPLKSLLDISQDGKTAKVMLIKANCATGRTVEILGRNNEYAIIKTPEGELKKTVNLYDTYILNPVKVKEGQIVEK